MPRLIYTPEGSDTPKTWDFSFGRLLSPERIAIEKLTGLGWQDVQSGFFGNQGVVIHAVLWTLLKREMPSLKADAVVFCDDEIDFDLTEAEKADAVAELRGKTALTELEADVLAELEARDTPEDGAPKED